MNIAALEAQRNRRIEQDRADTPARRAARDAIAQVDARLDAIRHGRDTADERLATYEGARRDYDTAIRRSLDQIGTDAPSLRSFLALEQEAGKLALCPSEEGTVDGATGEAFRVRAGPLAPALTIAIAADEGQATNSSRLADMVATYRQSAALNAPGTRTAASIDGMNAKLSAMRASEARAADAARARATAATARANASALAASEREAEADRRRLSLPPIAGAPSPAEVLRLHARLAAAYLGGRITSVPGEQTFPSPYGGDLYSVERGITDYRCAKQGSGYQCTYKLARREVAAANSVAGSLATMFSLPSNEGNSYLFVRRAGAWTSPALEASFAQEARTKASNAVRSARSNSDYDDWQQQQRQQQHDQCMSNALNNGWMAICP